MPSLEVTQQYVLSPVPPTLQRLLWGVTHQGRRESSIAPAWEIGLASPTDTDRTRDRVGEDSLLADSPSPVTDGNPGEATGSDEQEDMSVDTDTLAAGEPEQAATRRDAERGSLAASNDRRADRRLTADKLTVDDLLGQIDDDYPDAAAADDDRAGSEGRARGLEMEELPAAARTQGVVREVKQSK